ncbi:HET domain-containing protein, partial [Candidatus Bathyarchaeota archaeon]|nr:HET domain-containing protein [Candidatus Bathyarchaeota archaeon]
MGESDTQFAALSYTWGEAKGLVKIYIEGSPFEISPNLHEALLQLRRASNTSWLWIDAICIQQSDNDEKTWQVSQMGAIYSEADVVLIWLGLGCDETDRTMDWVSRVGPRALSSGTLDLWLQRSNLSVQKRRQDISDYITLRYSSSDERAFDPNVENHQVPELFRLVFDLIDEPGLHSDTSHPKDGDADLVTGILNLMRRDYWHRIWIFQEVSLGKETMMLCGGKAVSLDMFEATMIGVQYCASLGARFLHPEPTFARSLPFNFYDSIALETRRRFRRPAHGYMGLANIVYQRRIAPGRPHYSATDPRDILFGLLGIVPDNERKAVKVDYTLNMGQVFTVLTKAVIFRGDRDTEIYRIESCIPRDGAKQDNSLPSWAPDWREMGRRGVGVYSVNHDFSFEASTGIPMPVPPLCCKKDTPLELLRCYGCRVDTITEVMEPPQWVDTGRECSWADDNALWFTSR